MAFLPLEGPKATLIVPTFTSIVIFFGLRKIQSDLDLKLGPFKKSNLEKTAG